MCSKILANKAINEAATKENSLKKERGNANWKEIFKISRQLGTYVVLENYIRVKNVSKVL